MIGFAAVPRAESLRGLEVLIEETEDSLVVWKSSSEEVNWSSCDASKWETIWHAILLL